MQGGVFIGFLLCELVAAGLLRLVSRQHLEDMAAARDAGDYRARTLKLRELNTTLLVATVAVGLLLFFVPGPAMELLLGTAPETARVAALFCRVSAAAALPRAVSFALAEAVLVPQLGAVPAGALVAHALGGLAVVLVVRLLVVGAPLGMSARLGGAGFIAPAVGVLNDVGLAVVRS